VLHKRHTSWNSVAKITQFQESRIGCILGPFKKLISDRRHKQAQAQASASYILLKQALIASQEQAIAFGASMPKARRSWIDDPS
jgi:hypothetical protein